MKVLNPLNTKTETAKKEIYLPYTLQPFFTTAMTFSTVLYLDNNFHNNFLEKIFEGSAVVCEGLQKLPTDTIQHYKVRRYYKLYTSFRMSLPAM